MALSFIYEWLPQIFDELLMQICLQDHSYNRSGDLPLDLYCWGVAPSVSWRLWATGEWYSSDIWRNWYCRNQWLYDTAIWFFNEFQDIHSQKVGLEKKRDAPRRRLRTNVHPWLQIERNWYLIKINRNIQVYKAARSMQRLSSGNISNSDCSKNSCGKKCLQAENHHTTFDIK